MERPTSRTRRLRNLHRLVGPGFYYCYVLRHPSPKAGPSGYCLGYGLAYSAAEAGPEDEACMSALVMEARALTLRRD